MSISRSRSISEIRNQNIKMAATVPSNSVQSSLRIVSSSLSHSLPPSLSGPRFGYRDDAGRGHAGPSTVVETSWRFNHVMWVPPAVATSAWTSLLTLLRLLLGFPPGLAFVVSASLEVGLAFVFHLCMTRDRLADWLIGFFFSAL